MIEYQSVSRPTDFRREFLCRLPGVRQTLNRDSIHRCPFAGGREKHTLSRV